MKILLVVNFHYFGDEDRYKRGIFPISGEHFSNQINLLAQNFSFISQNDLVMAVEGKCSLPENSCLITFDDGLRCQYDIAFPILKQRGIPAVFFVGSYPYLERKTCLVHKIHHVLANYSTNEVIKLINGFIQKDKSQESFTEIIEKIKVESQQKYRYDEPTAASIKMVFNTSRVFNLKIRERIISRLFLNLVTDEKQFTDQLYLDKKQLIYLFDHGMLGLHSHSHKSLASLPNIQIEKDLKINKSAIENLVSGKIVGVSFPYGGKPDVNSKVLAVCQKIGFKLGFTMERAFNLTLANPLMFARLDTNDVIGGKNPMFEFKKNNLNILHGMTSKRNLFFKE